VSRQPRHRLGLVVEVGEPARAALAKAVEPLASAYPGIRWAEPPGWYIEVCALGAVEPERAGEVDDIVAAAARESAQIGLRLDGGAGIDEGRVLFAGVWHSDALVALRKRLVDRLEEAGFGVDDGDYLPHCVIGRTPGGTRLPWSVARSFQGPQVTWTARRLHVVRTRLCLGGVASEVRSTHEFGLPVAALP
jgi:2'-5' RNA ligase